MGFVPLFAQILEFCDLEIVMVRVCEMRTLLNDCMSKKHSIIRDIYTMQVLNAEAKPRTIPISISPTNAECIVVS